MLPNAFVLHTAHIAHTARTAAADGMIPSSILAERHLIGPIVLFATLLGWTPPPLLSLGPVNLPNSPPPPGMACNQCPLQLARALRRDPEPLVPSILGSESALWYRVTVLHSPKLAQHVRSDPLSLHSWPARGEHPHSLILRFPMLIMLCFRRHLSNARMLSNGMRMSFSETPKCALEEPCQKIDPLFAAKTLGGEVCCMAQQL